MQRLVILVVLDPAVDRKTRVVRRVCYLGRSRRRDNLDGSRTDPEESEGFRLSGIVRPLIDELLDPLCHSLVR
jgi:hypothetical protein